MTDAERVQNGRVVLSQAFGSYRAEWLENEIFELFMAPQYFAEVQRPGSAVLTGGRGTGKTTVLRALAWEGQQALKSGEWSSWSHLGIYIRHDTNQVATMQGGGLSEAEWSSRFAHYFNLLLIERVAAMSEALALPGIEQLAWELQGGLPAEGRSDSPHLLSARARFARRSFQVYLNNLGGDPPNMIPQGLAAEVIEEWVRESLGGLPIFVCLDEYENLLEYQQRVLNTLIKHSSLHLSYKVGIRELGWRTRQTLNRRESLRAPADYRDIQIENRLQGRFVGFARHIVQQRLERVVAQLGQGISDPHQLLPGLDVHAEAKLLGVERVASSLRTELRKRVSEEHRSELERIDDLRLYLIHWWSEGHDSDILDEFFDFLGRRSVWDGRFNNYAYAALFSIRQNRVGPRKHYAGFDTYCALAGGNLRFLMQLVEAAVAAQLESGAELTEPVNPAAQTEAAVEVGRLNLADLGGQSNSGVNLLRLVMSLGFVFSGLAADARGRTPELTQFHLAESFAAHGDAESIDPAELVGDGIMALALVRFHATKKPSIAEATDFDYQVHPIFSAFFMYSYRKKRKFSLTSEEFVGMVVEPRRTVDQVLERLNRSPLTDLEALPSQMRLFGEYFGLAPDA